jgi:hypothetical protein
MAIGTPVSHGFASRSFNDNDVVVSSFTSDADEFLIIGVVVVTGTSNTPDSVSGHGTWVQIGSTEQAATRHSLTLFGCISSGATSTITVSEATDAVMGVIAMGVSGVDVSGTVADAVEQTKQTNGYGTSATVTFDTTVTKTTIEYCTADDKVMTFENTELDNIQIPYSERIGNAYNSTGDDTPTVTIASNDHWALIALELVEASGVTAGLTGTITATVDEDDITTGGKTVIVTLTGDTFKAAGTGPIGSTADTQALIDGFDAASSPTNGWNNEVRDKALTSEVVRTSSTVATWTVAAQAGYDISSQETITGTIPTDVLVTGAGAITATPTFTIDEALAGRIMGSLAGLGGLAGMGGIAGRGGGSAG